MDEVSEFFTTQMATRKADILADLHHPKIAEKFLDYEDIYRINEHVKNLPKMRNMVSYLGSGFVSGENLETEITQLQEKITIEEDFETLRDFYDSLYYKKLLLENKKKQTAMVNSVQEDIQGTYNAVETQMRLLAEKIKNKSQDEVLGSFQETLKSMISRKPTDTSATSEASETSEASGCPIQ